MKTIGIIGAMPSELADIIKALPADEVVKKGKMTFNVHNKKDRRIVYACSGIAEVNSGICTQCLIDTFSPVAVINTGIAGGMDSKVKVCDIVISDEVFPHDLDSRFLRDFPPYCDRFPTDEKLQTIARQVCDEKGITNYTGRIISGETFVGDNELKDKIQALYYPLAVDMETAAIGQTAYINDVPFLSVRCISDNADNDGVMSVEKFETIAAKRVAEIVLETADRI